MNAFEFFDQTRADVRRGHQREQSGMGWADAVGGKGRLIFLYSRCALEMEALSFFNVALLQTHTPEPILAEPHYRRRH
jgi:hypothetical protein